MLQKDKPPGKVFSAGVVDEAGRGTHMAVDLRYMRGSRKTKYVFSVVMLGRSGTERVYQLEVIPAQHDVKDEHAVSHEHLGDRRMIGPALGSVGAMMKYWPIFAPKRTSVSRHYHLAPSNLLCEDRSWTAILCPISSAIIAIR